MYFLKEGPLHIHGIVIMRFLMRIYHTFANMQETSGGYLLTHTQELSSKCSFTVQDNYACRGCRWTRVGGAHCSSIQGTLFLCFTNRHHQISVSAVTFKQEYIIPYHYTRILLKTHLHTLPRSLRILNRQIRDSSLIKTQLINVV